ncbi:TolC family protein [Gammaproteobacteria bacterium]|nr:TolC family protein [Gammaproteobacteria bacterium]
MKRLAGVLLALSAPLLATELPPVLSLETAIDRAIVASEQSLLAGIDIADLAAQRERVDSEYGWRFRPILSLSSSDGNQSQRLGLAISRPLPGYGDVRADVSENRFDSNDTRQQVLSVGWDLPLFRRFGRDPVAERVTEIDDDLIAAERDLLLDRQRLILEVVQRYIEARRAQALVGLRDQQQQRAKLLLGSSRIAVENGRAIAADALQADLDWREAAAQAELAREAENDARAELRDVAALPTAREFSLQPLDELPLPAIDEAAMIESALGNRLDLAQHIDDVQRAQRQAQLARRGLLPDVLLGLRYDRVRTRPGSLDSDNYGLSLSSNNLLTHSTAELDVRLADSKVNRQRLLREFAERRVQREVRRATRALKRARRERDLAVMTNELATERREALATLFEAGRATLTQRLDGELSAARAEESALDAQGTVLFSQYELLATLGQLVEAEQRLKPPSVVELNP